jgi:regulator of sigma E protease
MEFVIKISQFLLSLSLLIVLHELGHFIPAKLFKTRVEKFYLFFDPWFSVFKKKIGETEYGIGWLPLGGYVKISGMIDESMDTEQMALPPQPWEFRSKPTWQRLIIMLGGVIVNFILGFFIFGMILFTYGEQYLPAVNAEFGIAVDSLGHDMGLRDGDHILKIGEADFERFEPSMLKRQIVLSDADKVIVQRDGREVSVPVDPKFVGMLASSKYSKMSLFTTRTPFEILTVEGKAAKDAGLEPGDRIISINDIPTPYYHDFGREVKNLKGATVALGYVRSGQERTTSMTLSDEGKLGVFAELPTKFFTFERQDYSFFEAMPAGVDKGWTFLTDQFKAFGQMFKGKIKASESLGGFGTITKLFPETWEWESFWRVTAILSLILGFMNLLPIPALDGGHVMFLLYEWVSGKKPSDKFMEYATMAGFAIVLALVIYANGLDVWRWLSGG